MTDRDDNAKFDNIDPELRRMIEDQTLKTITVKDAAMRLKNGQLVLRASDLLPKEKKPEGPEDERRPLTPAERQKKHYEKRKEEGWKKTWVPPELLDLADQLGGIEKITEDRKEWMRRTAEAENRQQGLPQKRSWLDWLFRR